MGNEGGASAPSALPNLSRPYNERAAIPSS